MTVPSMLVDRPVVKVRTLVVAALIVIGVLGVATLLGQVFGHFGWTAVIFVIGLSLGLGAWLARRMTTSTVASQAS